MDPKILFVLLAYLCIHFISMEAQQTRPASKITVRGIVYCDLCSTNTLSRHSYFLPGVDVHIDCKFEANTPTTSEFMSFSGNRTTDKNGVYKLQLPSVDGVKCGEGALIELLCRTFLIKSRSASCNAPGLDVGSKQKTIQIRHANHCTYWLTAMSFRPPKRNHTLCGI